MSFEEQIMSKDKYPSIFLKPNDGYCIFRESWPKFKNFKIIMLAFKDFSSLFKTISSIQFSNLFETKTGLTNVKRKF